MARPRSAELANRNIRIVEMASEGYTLQQIADNFGVSKQRISQIVQENYEDITDDATRDVSRTQLEYYLNEILHPMLRGPGKRLVSPSGRPVYELDPEDPSGKTWDLDKPVYDEYAKVDVINAALKVHERLAKFYHLDRAKGREKDESAEFTEAMQWVESLVAENKRLARLARVEDEITVEAEVIEDDRASLPAPSRFDNKIPVRRGEPTGPPDPLDHLDPSDDDRS